MDRYQVTIGQLVLSEPQGVIDQVRQVLPQLTTSGYRDIGSLSSIGWKKPVDC